MPKDKSQKLYEKNALEMGFTNDQMSGMGHLRRRFKEIAKAIRGNRPPNEIVLPKSKNAYDDIYNPEREAALNEAAAFYNRRYTREEAPDMYPEEQELLMENRQPEQDYEDEEGSVSSEDLENSLKELTDPAYRYKQEMLRRRMNR